MRGALVVLLLAGCGRLAFDSPGTTDAADDALAGDTRSDTPGSSGTVYLISSDGINPTELFTVELTTGQLTLVGSFAGNLGITGGLAYWDANTLYATVNNGLLEITLSPFGVASLGAMPGTWSAIERDGNLIFGVDQDGDGFGSFDPASPGSSSLKTPLGVDALGGDVWKIDGTWLWFNSNVDKQLYELAGGAIARGAPATGAPFIAGMVADDSGQLYVSTSSSTSDKLYPLDPISGQLGAPITMCVSCPTPYDLQSGDMTRAP